MIVGFLVFEKAAKPAVGTTEISASRFLGMRTAEVSR